MTVNELIVELKKFNGSLEVITEGCDCDGDIGSVTLEEYDDGSYIYLKRSLEF